MFNLFKSYNTDMKRIFLLMTGVLVMASMSCGKPTNANAMANEEASEVQTEVTADVPTAEAADDVVSGEGAVEHVAVQIGIHALAHTVVLSVEGFGINSENLLCFRFFFGLRVLHSC